MTCIVSAIPGRLRLRHPALRRPGRLAALQQTLAAWPEVLELQASPATGSLLLRYDALALDEALCARRCEAAVAELLPGRADPAPEARQARNTTRASALRANRLAKRGMLASLAVSLLLAATGVKRLHVWTGLVFLHALGAHLWVHRRHLLR